MSSNCVSGATSELEGNTRRYKHIENIKLTSQLEDSYKINEKHTAEIKLEFADQADGDSIQVKETQISDYDMDWSYQGGMFEYENSDLKIEATTLSIVGLGGSLGFFDIRIYTIEQSVFTGEPYFSDFNFYIFTLHSDSATYLSNFSDTYEAASQVEEIVLDTNSIKITSLFEEPNSDLLLSGSSPALISEELIIVYDAAGLLKSFSYELLVTNNDLNLIDYSYDVKSGFFQFISLPIIGAILISIVMIGLVVKKYWYDREKH